jgi:hypothetical protein
MRHPLFSDRIPVVALLSFPALFAVCVFCSSFSMEAGSWDDGRPGGDPNRSRRTMEAMMKMGKLDIAALERAADGA